MRIISRVSLKNVIICEDVDDDNDNYYDYYFCLGSALDNKMGGYIVFPLLSFCLVLLDV